MSEKSKFIKPIILGIALAVILVSLLQFSGFFGPKVKKDTDNPFEYNIDSLKEIPKELLTWEEIKTLNLKLDLPKSIATDVDNNIYIAGSNKVVIFDGSYKLISNFDISETGNCLFVINKKIYIGMRNHVEVYDNNGEQLQKFESLGDRSVLTSIAVDDANIYVADAGNRVALKLDHFGNIVGKIGEKDESRDIPGFIIPSGYFDLGFGRDGELWVVDPGRHFVQNYSFDGDLVSQWGVASQSVYGFCGCCNPSHFTMLSDGSFITSEKGIERVKEYSVTGELKSVIAGPNSFDEGTTGLDLAVNSQNNILVLDPVRRQLRVFEQKEMKDKYETRNW